MKTRSTLNSLIPELIKHIDKNRENIKLNSILIDISNGNLLPYVRESLKRELNKRAYNTSKDRIPPINILKKLQLKLSKVYARVLPLNMLFSIHIQCPYSFLTFMSILKGL